MSRRYYVFTAVLWSAITACNAVAGNWSALIADVAVLFFAGWSRDQTKEAHWWQARYEELRTQLAAAGVKVTYEGDDPLTSRRDAGEDNPSQGGTV